MGFALPLSGPADSVSRRTGFVSASPFGNPPASLSFTPVRIPDVCCVSRRYLKSQGVAVPCSGVGQLSPLVQLAALCVCQFLLPKRLALEVACLFNSGRSPRLFPCLEKWQHPGTRAAVSECSASALQDSWCRCKNKRRRKKTVCFC